MGGGEWASRTDVGRIRSNNEDKCLVDRAAELYVVCDGMGGHNAGEVASKICCDTLHEEIGDAIERRRAFVDAGDIGQLRGVAQAVVAATLAACRAIWAQARANSEQAGMGTTCTAVLMAGRDKAVMVHVGDSRLYMLHGGDIVQLSEDHTYVGELVKRGALTPEQALHHPQGNILSRAMGVQEGVVVDQLTFDVDPGDTLMLCSDGVYNYYPDARELGAMLADPDLEHAAGAVVARALERGGHDNCTVVLWRVPAAAGRSMGPPARRRATMLAAVPPFTHLDTAEQVAVLGLTQTLAVPAGQVVRRQGLRDGAIILALEGELEVQAPHQAGRPLHAGDAFGLPCLVGHPLGDLTVRSQTACRLLVLERDDLMALVDAQPLLGSKVLLGLAEALAGGEPRAAPAPAPALGEPSGPLSF